MKVDGSQAGVDFRSKTSQQRLRTIERRGSQRAPVPGQHQIHFAQTTNQSSRKMERKMLRPKGQRQLNLVDLDDWLIKLSKRKEYDQLLHGALEESFKSKSRQTESKPEQKGRGKKPDKISSATSTINHESSASPVTTSHAAAASTTASKKPTLPPPVCCVFKDAKQYINECPSYKSMSLSKQSETTYEAGRCLKGAVGLNHTARTCMKSVRCTVDGCAKPWQHITLLHGFKIAKKTVDSSDAVAATTASSVTPSATTSTCSVLPSESKSSRKALFKIVGCEWKWKWK